jgi:hypothetical protein
MPAGVADLSAQAAIVPSVDVHESRDLDLLGQQTE